MIVIQEQGSRPIKAWVGEKPMPGASYEDVVLNGATVPDIEDTALQQAKNLARLPFIAKNGVALMPDVHAGVGSTIGSVIATHKAIIPAAVGVDIGCGMCAVKTNLKASQLPDSMKGIFDAISKAVPVGFNQHQENSKQFAVNSWDMTNLPAEVRTDKLHTKAVAQLGTLGGGNHFIEICLDENQDVWVMLHSGSRGVGNVIGTTFIDKAKEHMARNFIELPDPNLAFLPEGDKLFQDYISCMLWAQHYAKNNRKVMLENVLKVLAEQITDLKVTEEAINVHHNYAQRENHFGQNLWITRKGATRAGKGELGIIPGSMGQKSYIVCGKGHVESYCSCSHGAGRSMSRTEAKKRFSLTDLVSQTQGVECRKDEGVLDEIPGAYKDIDVVMENQKDLVEVVHTLKQVMCIKG
jgi:tRNA-splicing ligase RtcB